MIDEHHPDDLAPIYNRLAYLEKRERRRRVSRRLLPMIMAALLVALIPLAALAAGPFTDLNPNSGHNPNIRAIAEAGITTGCNPPENTEYCPNDTVTREQMASFLARAAGLGSNPPVANAKTAQSAVSAQTAQTATNAQNAANAGNANTVGGLAPNGLVRAARSAPLTGGTILTATFATLTTVTIDAPASGFVLVTGGAAIQGGAGVVEMRLRDTAPGGATSPFQYSSTDAVITNQAATLTWLFPVAGGGAKSFVLEARRYSGTTYLAGGNSAQMTALYVPFGSTGAGTLEVGEGATARSADGATPRQP